MFHPYLNFMLRLIFFTILICSIHSCTNTKDQPSSVKQSSDYSDLIILFKDWRAFEIPPLSGGAPDYTAESFSKRLPAFTALQQRLLAIDTSSWPLIHKTDWQIVQAEMNGYDFNHRILMPWVRDPAFYTTVKTARSDVPAHEGPTHHKTIELWQYTFPLSTEQKNKLISGLKIIPPLHDQARKNLTGNAKDLWITGIRDIKFQIEDLKSMIEKPGIKEDHEIISEIDKAIKSTIEFAAWLESQSNIKTGPSGIGKENYSWYQQHVQLVPLTWDDEVQLLKRELARAWSSLKLEEHRNRNLPAIPEVSSVAEYTALAEKSASNLMQFLKDKEILTIKDYYDEALRAHLGTFAPKEKRNFFSIGSHYDPRPLYSHFYHWFELADLDRAPHKSEIRKAPLLYNIFVSHNEGIATAAEEIFMQAGLYDDSPRSKEIVYIMLAQRAARGLGSLYAHANEMTMEEAGGIHSEYTPRGWMKTEKELRIFEQHLYLRQPGYGTSYITGKYLIEDLMMHYILEKESQAQEFKIKDFLDAFNASGCIPVSLSKMELTGDYAPVSSLKTRTMF